MTSKRLLGGPLRLAHPRPPTLPFWAAALPRWASLNSPIAYLECWTKVPCYPTFFLPLLLRSPCTSYHDRLSKESLLTLSFNLPTSPPHSPTRSLVHLLPRSPQLPPALPSRRHLSTRHVTSALQQSRLNGTYDRCPSHQDTPTHPLCKADHPPSLPAHPHERTPFPLRTQTRTYYSEYTEDKARQLRPRSLSSPVPNSFGCW